MIRACRGGLLLVALVASAPAALAQSEAVGVRDRASMFSKGAVGEASTTLRQVLDKTKWQVAIETVPALDGKTIQAATLENAKKYNVHGMYVLIASKDKKIGVEASDSAQKVFTKARREAIEKAFIDAMRANKPDDGLRAIVAETTQATNTTIATSKPATKRLTASDPAGVYDTAGMFTASALREADQGLKDLEKRHKWQAVIETIPSLEGRDIRETTLEHARAKEVHGLYVLVARDDKKFYVESSNSASGVFGQPQRDAVLAALRDGFRENKFDDGLKGAVKAIGEAMTSAKTTVAVAKPAPAPTPTPKAEDRPMLAGPGEPTKAATTSPPTKVETAQKPAEAPRSTPAPAPAPAPEPKAATGSSKLPLILLLVGCAIVGIWLLRKMFGGGRAVQQPAFAPAPGPRPQAPPQGFGPAVGGQPMGGMAGPMTGGQPGYGYGAPPPGGYPPGYVPPQQGGGMGAFVKGALGGAAGAVVGNIIYDQFGRPHPAQAAEGHAGHAAPPPGGPVPPHETFQADNVTAGGWDTPAPPPPADDWGGGGGGGGDWGAPPAPADTGGDWGGGDAGGGGDGGGGDWGGGDTGGGGDWGGGDTGGGGDWGGGDDPNAGGW